ncbi:MAG: SDR family oxidoreductase [Bdellovibrio sp.]|nr:SDR family oxidoreductase [Bdellovibrio sp.]
MHILLTGGTGFLGESLIPWLERAPGIEKIHLLVRPQSANRALFLHRGRSKVSIVRGDITLPQVFLRDTDKQILSQISTIVHLAAYYNLSGSYPECFINNVVGTQNLLFLARQCPHLQAIHYASSIAVVGEYHGPFLEDELNKGQRFHDAYGKTKFEAELLIEKLISSQALAPQIKTRLYRLGILVGDRQSGAFKEKNGPYYFLEFLSKLSMLSSIIKHTPFLALPFAKKSLFPLAPVDWVSEVLSHGILNVCEVGRSKTYHVIPRRIPTMEEFLHDALETFDLKRPLLAIPRNALNELCMKQVGLPPEFSTYVYSKTAWQRAQFEQDFPQFQDLDYHDFKKIFFAGAFKRWGNK